MVEFISSKSDDDVVEYLSNTLKSHLSLHQKVLWLMPGGSNIKVAADTSNRLIKFDLTNLTVSLTDERFGEPGHKDSNWQQLLNAGLDLPGANLWQPLTGKSQQETADNFADFLSKELKLAHFSIGFFGMGKDSHIAGIKPLSPATTSSDLAIIYRWQDFERLTMTFPAIEKLDLAVCYAKGQAKHQAVLKLKQQLPIDQYPSQILNRCKKAIMFSDT